MTTPSLRLKCCAALVALVVPARAVELAIGVAMPLDAHSVDLTLAMLLGLEHFNARNGSVVRALGEDDALRACDVRLRVEEVVDTRRDPLVASRALFRLADSGVVAVLGGARSETTGVMGTYGALLPLVQLSPLATSPMLDELRRYPYLRRMAPSDASTARAILAHARRFDVSELGVVHAEDAYGRGLADALALEATGANVALTAAAFSFDEGGGGVPGASMHAAMRAMVGLDGEPLRVLVLVAFDRHALALARAAAEAGVAGPGGHTIVTHSLTMGWLATASDEALVRVLDGAARIEASASAAGGAAAFGGAWRGLERGPLEAALPPHARANGSAAGVADARLAFAYDAGVAIGVAACNTSAPSEPAALLAALSALELEGASGAVRFDGATGCRPESDAPFDVQNVVWDGGAGRMAVRHAGVWAGGRLRARAGSDEPPPPFRFGGGAAQLPSARAHTLLRVGFLGRWAGDGAADTTSRAAMVAAQLAAMHFNARNGTFVPAFAAAEDAGCDVRVELGLGHTRASPIGGLEAYLSGRRKGWGAVVGASMSSVSQAVAQLASIDGTPMVSYLSTSPALSDVDELQTFARVIPSDLGGAYAAAHWLRHAAARRAGVLFAAGEYGEGYAAALQQHCAALGISLHRAPFDPSAPSSLRAAAALLSRADARYVIAISPSEALRAVLAEAVAHGLAGGAAARTHHWAQY